MATNLTNKMSPDNPTQILRAHDLSSIRTFQGLSAVSAAATATPAATSAAAAAGTTYHTASAATTTSVANNHSRNMVLSTMSLPDGQTALLIQPQLIQTTAGIQQHQQHQQSPQQQVQRIATATTANGLRITANNINGSGINAAVSGNNLSTLLAAATATTKATIISGIGGGGVNNNNIATIKHNNNNNNIGTPSKYVFLQQNGIGPTIGTGSSVGGGAVTLNRGNMVLVTTEQLNLNGNVSAGSAGGAIESTAGAGVLTATGKTATGTGTGTGENDEELRPLTWLSDTNLIPGIVTSSASASASATTTPNAGNGNVKRPQGANVISTNSGNICIVSAAGNAHDLIEELPPHVAGEENVIATTTSVAPSGDIPSNVIITSSSSNAHNNNNTTLTVGNFQQQFVASSKRFGIAASAPQPIGNFTLSPQDANAMGATTTVHVGPSGTTTVVEYKTNGNFVPIQRQFSAAAATATNLMKSKSNVIGQSYQAAVSSASAATSGSASVAAVGPSLTVSVTGNNPSKQTATATATLANVIVANGNAGHNNINSTNSANNNNNNNSNIVISNGIPNTIHQGQKQFNNNNNNNNNMHTTITSVSTASSSTASATHHPHKKYLREKMNVLDHGGGVGGGIGGSGNGSVPSSHPSIGHYSTQSINNPVSVVATTITVVSSPASSNNSTSSGATSTSSTNSSTAAVYGGNSPPALSKSFANLGTGHTTTTTTAALNYSTTGTGTGNGHSTGAGGSFVSINATNVVTSTTGLSSTGGVPLYTIVNQKHVTSAAPTAVTASPESTTISSKDYYTVNAIQQPQQQQQQQQQQHQQHHHLHQDLSVLRSPTPYSSYDNDSLKDFEISTSGSPAPGSSTGYQPPQQQLPPPPPHQQSSPPKSGTAAHTPSPSPVGAAAATSNAVTPQKQKHPNNVPYDPLIHTHNKPPFSFSSLIFMAIEGSNEKALPVKEIYAWIVQHFPYFKTAPTGWKNSVRHNLSLNKSFVKVEKAPNMGKGSLWRVEQQQRQNLIQALNRSPCFPNSAVEKISQKNANAGTGTGAVGSSAAGYDAIDGGSPSPSGKHPQHNNSRFDSHLFPYVAKAMNEHHHILNDVMPDDDDTPSDYSTTNNSSVTNRYQQNNNKNNNNNNNNINNNTKYNYTIGGSGGAVGTGAGASAGGGVGGGGGGGNKSLSIMGSFSNYESIERLARDCGADSIDDVNAATAMLALKHGPKVFTETFHNGAPVITSSPSEDHTYSAGGGSTCGSGASTPLTNGHMVHVITNGNSAAMNGQPNGCDNQSNCASSDAAYESSEEIHNITPEELEDRRQRDGVDALLSLSLSSVVDSNSASCSPNKRPSSTSVEEEHMTACMENKNISSPSHRMGKMALLSVAASYGPPHHHSGGIIANAGRDSPQQQMPSQHMILDEGYNTQNYYSANNINSNSNSTTTNTNTTSSNGNNHHSHQHLNQNNHSLSSPSPPRKPKPFRSQRAKIRRKPIWLR